MRAINKIVGIALLFLMIISQAWPNDLSYSGRLVQGDGSPVTGTVNLRFDIAYSGAPSVILCTKTVPGVPLTNGVFHVTLNIVASNCTPAKEFAEVLNDVPVSESVILKVTDLTNTKSYPFQAFKSVPYAIQAQVAKTLAPMGASVGQFLKWDGSNWVPGTGGTGAGTVTEIETGSGLVGGPITGSGTISIANNGVTSTHITDGTILDADISSSAAIARSKLASGTANQVVINDGSGVLSSVAQLPVSKGGTGSSTVEGARASLGLGSAAVLNVGDVVGSLFTIDSVPSCGANQKLQMSLGPIYSWSCVSDLASDASKLSLGGGTMSGNINMDGNKIQNLPIPVDDDDVATKKYVDDALNGGGVWERAGDEIYYTDGNVGIGVLVPSEKLHLSGNLLVDGRIKFKSTTANFVELKSPAGLAATLTFNLPSSYGTNGYVLSTDGAGGLTWIPAGGAPSGNAGGDLSGTYPNPSISNLSATKISAGNVSNTEFDFLDGVTSSIQTQLNSKEDTITVAPVTPATKYWRGDKTWQTLETDVVSEGLTNRYFTEARVRSTTLTGYSTGTAGALTTSDSILGALGKLEASINSVSSNGQWNKSSNDISYTAGNVGDWNIKYRFGD